MLSTGYVTNQMAMPVCKYEILSGGINGAPLRYAKVTMQFTLEWPKISRVVYIFRLVTWFIINGPVSRRKV